MFYYFRSTGLGLPPCRRLRWCTASSACSTLLPCLFTSIWARLEWKAPSRQWELGTSTSTGRSLTIRCGTKKRRPRAATSVRKCRLVRQRSRRGSREHEFSKADDRGDDDRATLLQFQGYDLD